MIRNLIYLDLDGVLADFQGHAEATEKPLIEGRRDWASMGREWWAAIPAYAGALEFYREVETLGDVVFLSAVIWNPGCHSGKADWLLTFAGEGHEILNRLILCPRHIKQALASPDAVLIDDNPDNINEWTHAGGSGVLHDRDYETTLQKLEKAIKQ